MSAFEGDAARAGALLERVHLRGSETHFPSSCQHPGCVADTSASQIAGVAAYISRLRAGLQIHSACVKSRRVVVALAIECALLIVRPGLSLRAILNCFFALNCGSASGTPVPVLGPASSRLCAVVALQQLCAEGGTVSVAAHTAEHVSLWWRSCAVLGRKDGEH